MPERHARRRNQLRVDSHERTEECTARCRTLALGRIQQLRGQLVDSCTQRRDLLGQHVPGSIGVFGHLASQLLVRQHELHHALLTHATLVAKRGHTGSALLELSPCTLSRLANRAQRCMRLAREGELRLQRCHAQLQILHTTQRCEMLLGVERDGNAVSHLSCLCRMENCIARALLRLQFRQHLLRCIGLVEQLLCLQKARCVLILQTADQALQRLLQRRRP